MSSRKSELLAVAKFEAYVEFFRCSETNGPEIVMNLLLEDSCQAGFSNATRNFETTSRQKEGRIERKKKRLWK
jgi:hypothetical protein